MPGFDIDQVSGLSPTEAEEKIRLEGYNELPTESQRGLFRLFIGIFHEPMFLLLVASGFLYFIIGDFTEGMMLMSFVVVVIGITVYQKRKTERALEALRNLSSPRALVIRDGMQQRIAGRDVVTGDMVILSEGDRVPADGILLIANNISVDESLLTGEAVPVRKTAGKNGMPVGRPGGDDRSSAYSGTLVVSGQGLLHVTATGARTEMGKIGAALKTVERGDTRLKLEIDRLVGTVALLGISLCAVIVIIYGTLRFNWVGGFLAGITLAMAILPEEFPVVLTIFLALGAWRISKSNVLTRQIPAIETLGSATVLCVDKTGTLTLNRLSVARFFAQGELCDYDSAGSRAVTDSCHEVAEYAILACKRDPFDPMEKALFGLKDGDFGKTEHIHANWILVQEYPLSMDLLAMSNVWRSPDGDRYVIAAKGAPEAIVDLCHLDAASQQDLRKWIDTMASDGLRIIGVARSTFSLSGLPAEQHGFPFEFLGLIGFADPVRPHAAEAVRECFAAGIRVIMITGDYPLTARNIARRIGLPDADRIITGPGLDAMDDRELRKEIRTAGIFARVVPEQKLRIVNALKENGEVVAMTGDGVNDAPALKSADIGIAMGGKGTDVAREASSLVLLDDNFISIVGAIRQGRRIFDNLKKAIAYIISVHVPVAGMSLIPVLFNMPLVLLPVHIVFLELIIDPACSVVFESEREEQDIMDRPPRNKDEGIITRRSLALSLLQGFVVLAVVLTVYINALSCGIGEPEVRALTFTTIVVANICLILTNRSWVDIIFTSLRKPNQALTLILAGTTICLLLVLYVPVLRDLFGFGAIGTAGLLTCIVAGTASVLWFEGYKLLNKKNRKGSGKTR